MIVKEKYKSKVIGGAMVRTINVNEITKNIKEMCIEANHYLSPDMDKSDSLLLRAMLLSESICVRERCPSLCVNDI